MLPKLIIGVLPLIRTNGAGSERGARGTTGAIGAGAGGASGARDTTRALLLP